MANTLKMTQKLTDLGIFKKSILLTNPINLPHSSAIKVQVAKVQVSNRIPNVFDSTNVSPSYFNNTRLRIGTDTIPYITIKLEAGIYLSPTDFQNAINAVINLFGWWLDPKIPGLSILWNYVVDKFVIKIDSAKLNPAFGTQFRLDLREATTNSTLYRTLGFLSTTEFLADNTYDAPNYPVLDTQGSTATVCCTIMPHRMLDNSFLQYVADIDVVQTYLPGNYEWPSGNVANDRIVYTGPRTISEATIYCLTETGVPMVFLYGSLKIELLFYY